MILLRINPLSNLRQSRRNKLSKIAMMILNHSLLLRRNKSQSKMNNLSITLNIKEPLSRSRRSPKRNWLIKWRLMKRRRRSQSVLGKKNCILSSTVQLKTVQPIQIDSKANSPSISAGTTRTLISRMMNNYDSYSSALRIDVISVKLEVE